MTGCQGKTINAIIREVIQGIPVVWPLQKFIATNPCWDLIQYPIGEVSALLPMTKHDGLTLPLSVYWEEYDLGKISQPALQAAIKAFFSKTTEMTDEGLRLADSLCFSQESLYHFLTKKQYQAQLLQALESTLSDKAATPCILYASQIQDFGYDNALALIKEDCFSWLSAYFNPTGCQKTLFASIDQASLESKHHFFDLWRIIMLEKRRHWATILADYAGHLDQTIEKLLAALSVPESSKERYLFDICWQLKGWIGYLKWQERYPNHPNANRRVEVAEIIAIWLANEVYWLRTHRDELQQFTPNYNLEFQNIQDNALHTIWVNYIVDLGKPRSDSMVGEVDRLFKQCHFSFQALCWLWQRASEMDYQLSLSQAVFEKNRSLLHNTAVKKATSTAQWVFCIDVRSEGLRRHLEEIAHYETFGFAGFFGFAYQLKHNARLTYQCPALIEPTLLVEILDAPESVCAHESSRLKDAIARTKEHLLAPFALYEILGFWFVLTLLFKSYANRFLAGLKRLCFASAMGSTKSDAQHLPTYDCSTLTLENQVSLARGLLEGIGLLSDFSPFVIICGHTATTENNPYQAALDCGACGGNSGMSNAIIACQVLNDEKVRASLAEQGILIPSETRFIGACHDTTTDCVRWYETQALLTDSQSQSLDQIKAVTLQAGAQLRAERLKDLPGGRNVFNRSSNWAELIPEWGLVNNAAMIIAPRQLTAGLNLDRRVFLHSYAAEHDPEGHLLASIFLGPMIVAHWINSQYYFSSVAPLRYGSGNKAIHNLLPELGVIEGNQSDLQYGLPLQSVYYQDERIHKPQRLYVLVDAKPDRITAIINQHPVLQSLVNGEWLFIESLRIE